MILLIDNYDSFTFNLFQLVEKLGRKCKVIRNDEKSLSEIESMDFTHLIISPGPGRPEEAGVTVDLIRRLQGKKPILGVCLGHQAIGHVFGGKVVRGREAFHGKQSLVHHRQKGMFKDLQSPLLVARYHSLVIEKESLPTCLAITSETEDGVIMGVRHRELDIEGVQFHPESMATENGSVLIANFLSRVS